MKINLHNLMTRAWEIRKTDGCSMSEALRLAWTEIKTAKYTFDMNANRESVVSCLVKLVANIRDIHDQHKADILRAALRLDTIDGIATMCGKWVGLCKWAVRNA